MTGAGDEDDHDPEADRGLAKERTDLAWTRTAISFGAAGAAILKNHLIPGLIVLALGLATWGLRRVFPAFSADDASRRRRLLLVTIAVTTTAGVALAVAVTARPGGR